MMPSQLPKYNKVTFKLEIFDRSLVESSVMGRHVPLVQQIVSRLNFCLFSAWLYSFQFLPSVPDRFCGLTILEILNFYQNVFRYKEVCDSLICDLFKKAALLQKVELRRVWMEMM